MKINISVLLLICLLFSMAQGQKTSGRMNKVNWKKVNLLVFTKNGKGYVHENIPFAVNCLQKLSRQQGFKMDVSENPAVFTMENLQPYSMLIVASTNNDVFETDDQRLAVRHFIEAGGGCVCLHSVVGTERNWTWFKM